MTFVRSAALAGLLVLAGCGSADRPGTTSGAPTARAAATTTTASTTTTPSTSQSTATSAPVGPTGASTSAGTSPTAATPADPGGASDEAQPGGAGDEEPIRQPVTFTLSDGDVRPGSVTVAPFLPVALSLVNHEPGSRTVRLIGAGVEVAVPAGERVERRLPGLRGGTYTLSVDGGRAVASLVVGADVGP